MRAQETPPSTLPPSPHIPSMHFLTTPMEVSAVARLMMVGIRLNFPALGGEYALDDCEVWGKWGLREGRGDGAVPAQSRGLPESLVGRAGWFTCPCTMTSMRIP